MSSCRRTNTRHGSSKNYRYREEADEEERRGGSIADSGEDSDVVNHNDQEELKDEARVEERLSVGSLERQI